MTVETDPCPERDAIPAEHRVGNLEGDRGHVAPGEDVAGRSGEHVGAVLVRRESFQELRKGDPVAPERITDLAEPRGASVRQPEDLACRSGPERHSIDAREALVSFGKPDGHLLSPIPCGLRERHPERPIRVRGPIPRDDELVERVRPQRNVG